MHCNADWQYIAHLMILKEMAMQWIKVSQSGICSYKVTGQSE